MDSRIREIEHRLARAKTGLAEGGREDYLKQLYLLNAEIHATIRENGDLPEHLKELLQDTAPRRRSYPAANAGMAFAAMLLVAAITFAVSWLNQSGAAGIPAFAPQSASITESTYTAIKLPEVKDFRQVVEPDNSAVNIELAAFNGETSSPENMTDPGTEQASRPISGSAGQTTGQPNRLIQASNPTPANSAGDQEDAAIAVRFVPPLIATPEHGGVAGETGRVVRGENYNPLDQMNMYPPQQTTGFDWTIARFALPGADVNSNQEIPVVNRVKQQVQTGEKETESEATVVEIVDKQLSTSDEDVDN